MGIYKLQKYCIFLLIYIALVSPAQWCSVSIGNTTLTWAISFLIIYFTVQVKKRGDTTLIGRNYKIVYIYLIWVAVCSIRGAFVADNYWEYKNLINGTLNCLLPIFVYVFYSPEFTARFYRKWVKVCLPLFFLFYSWTVTPGEVNFYLAPLFFLGCFLPLIPMRSRVIIIVLLVFMLIADLSARSQVLKSLIAFIFSFFCLKYNLMGEKC